MTMSYWHSLKWINRHGTSCFLLALLLLFCVGAHSMATSWMGLFVDFPPANLPPRLMRNITGIEFVKANWPLPLVYLLFFAGMLLYMEFRSTPRWAVWVSFVVMSLPIVVYLLICLRVGTGLFFTNPSLGP
jgi:hypothetical protein